MNVERLQEVANAILANPKHFDINNWFYVPPGVKSDTIEPNSMERCGTTACIAGWAVAIEAQKNKKMFKLNFLGLDDGSISPSVLGAELLGITDEQANSLFYRDEWPEYFQDEYHYANSPEERAQVAYDRIQDFIEAGE